MSIIISSRRFNPGHLSHLIANYKLLVESGNDVEILCDVGFKPMLKDDSIRVSFQARDCSISTKNSLIIWFPSFIALFDMIRARLFYKTKIVYVFHEPFDSVSAYIKAGFGIRKTIKICITGLVNYGLVCLSNKIILPSSRAFETFNSWRIAKKKKNIQIPLLFDDEIVESNYSLEREYVSYIGTIAEDHAFDEFIKYLIYIYASGIPLNYKFLIASRNNLPADIFSKLKPLVDSGMLDLECGRILDNAEINECYAKSYLVWNAYRRSMQSGVLPKAYMFGTPVIVTSNNLSEFAVEGATAVRISNDYIHDEITDKISYVIDNFEVFSSKCREFFLNTFYYKAQSEVFIRFIDENNDN